MKLIKVAALVVIGFVSAHTYGDEASKKEAEMLLASMNMEATFDSIIDQMLTAQVQQNPAMAPYRDVMEKFFSQYMSYKSLAPELVAIYAEAFTAQELKEIRSFYETPVGQKTLSLLPQLSAQGAQIGMSHVQAHMAELQQMVAARKQELDAAQPPSPPAQ